MSNLQGAEVMRLCIQKKDKGREFAWARMEYVVVSVTNNYVLLLGSR